ncbi:MAG: hypothetical protein V2B13_08680 [Pseudomonadota bacterium]
MKISLIEQLSGIGLVAMLGEKAYEAVHFLLDITGCQQDDPGEPTEESSDGPPISTPTDGDRIGTD